MTADDTAGSGPELPLPGVEAVTAARRRMVEEYSSGVERLGWEHHGIGIPDLEAVRRVIAGAGGSPSAAAPVLNPATQPTRVPMMKDPDTLDLAAALVLLEAAHQELAELEVSLLDVVRSRGLAWEGIAAVLDLPDAQAARDRYVMLRDRLGGSNQHAGGSEPAP